MLFQLYLRGNHYFDPIYMKHASHEFCKNLETHKYCWVDDPDLIEFVKLEFQKKFKYIEICNNSIRINYKSYIKDWITFIMHYCDIDMREFEWKPLNLKIENHNKIAYTKQKSKRYYDVNHKYDYGKAITIPWYIYIPYDIRIDYYLINIRE